MLHVHWSRVDGNNRFGILVSEALIAPLKVSIDPLSGVRRCSFGGEYGLNCKMLHIHCLGRSVLEGLNDIDPFHPQHQEASRHYQFKQAHKHING